MPAYKDETKKKNQWYAKFYYHDWQGTNRQKIKRGFQTKKEALSFERQFKEQFSKNPDITFYALYEKYKAHKTPRIKKSTAYIKYNTIENNILPFFKDMVISEITPETIAVKRHITIATNRT